MKEFSTCPLCGHKKLRSIYMKKWKGSHFTRCRQCRLVFQNPQESPHTTKERYDNEYFLYEVTNEHNFFGLVKATMEDFGVTSLLNKGAKVLEIGCATGLFLKYMNECGYQSTGVEICSESAEYGRKKYGVSIINAPLEESGLADESFDFIHFSHLIEHVNDPFAFLKNVYRLLKKSGFIIVTTPNADGLFARYYQDNWRCIVDDHLFLFNRNNLIQTLEQSGFIPEEFITWGSIPSGKTLPFIKKRADYLVKATGSGDVVSVFAYKKVF